MVLYPSTVPALIPVGKRVFLVPELRETRGVEVDCGVAFGAVPVFGVGVAVGTGVEVGWMQEAFADPRVGFCLHHDWSVGIDFPQDCDSVESP